MSLNVRLTDLLGPVTGEKKKKKKKYPREMPDSRKPAARATSLSFRAACFGIACHISPGILVHEDKTVFFFALPTSGVGWHRVSE